MIITNFNKTEVSGRVRVSASVIWENAQKKQDVIYVETLSSFGESLSASGECFLNACFAPAMFHGEKRIRIDAPVDPYLIDGLTINMQWFEKWYGENYKPPVIECAQAAVQTLSAENESAQFLSGGVDSLYCLIKNVSRFGVDHPLRVKHCFFIYGFDIGWKQDEFEIYDRAFENLNHICSEVGVTLVPVYTNLRSLEPNTKFWLYWHHAAALSAVAHAFQALISSVTIAADDDIATLIPFGSHPLINFNYGSSGLTVKYDGFEATRFEKINLISKMPIILDRLRVCVRNEASDLNCSKCEKCIRTMLAFEILGVLDKSSAFAPKSVDSKLLSRLTFDENSNSYRYFYEEMAVRLQKTNRVDLFKKIKSELGWKGRLKAADKKYLRGLMANSWKLGLKIKSGKAGVR